MRKTTNHKGIKINSKGFTLIELIATILILSIILSITLFIAINVINKAKAKTYQVTVNNITGNANNYLLENSNRLNFVPAENYEYQCITVKNLIELGYLDGDVINAKVDNDTTVKETDMIYVERNINTKAVTKSIYTGNNSTYAAVCSVAMQIGGRIQFVAMPDSNTWARSKDVTINYTLSNVSDMSSVSTYEYNYDFNSLNASYHFSSLTASEKLTVTETGTIVAEIKNESSTIATGSYVVSKIDRTGPVIVLATDPAINVSESAIIKLKVTDNESGVDYRSFTTDDLVVTIGGENANEYTLVRKDKTDDGSLVNYDLTIKDTEHSGAVQIVIDTDKVFDNVENGNEETTLNPKIVWKRLASIPTNTYCISGLKYNGAVQTIVKTAGEGYTWKSGTTLTNAGSQTVIATLKDGYIWRDNTTTDKTFTCSIAKKDISVSWGSVVSFPYDGNPHAPSASVSTGISSETMTINQTKQTNAGTNYSSVVTCKGITGGSASCNNYSLYNNTKNFDITAIFATCPTITNYSGQYDGKYHSIGTSGEVGGVVQYRTSSTGTWSNTNPQIKDAGTTTVYVRVYATGNYLTNGDCGSGTVQIIALPTATKKPNTTTKKPNTTTNKPNTTVKLTTKKPNTTTKKPNTTTKKPNTTTKKPNTTTNKPNTTVKLTTKKPNTTTNKPNTTTKKPNTTTKKPNTTTKKPNTTTKKPNTTTKKPNTTTKAANSYKCYNCYGTYAWANEDLTISGCNVTSYTTKDSCLANNVTPTKTPTPTTGSSSTGQCSLKSFSFNISCKDEPKSRTVWCCCYKYTDDSLCTDSNAQGKRWHTCDATCWRNCDNSSYTVYAYKYESFVTCPPKTTTKKPNTTTKKPNTTTKKPTTTTFSCYGLSYSDCQTGQAASYCSYCQGQCKPKADCVTTAKSTTKKPNTTTKKPNTTTKKPNTTTKKPNTTTKKPNTTTKKPNTTTKKPNTTTKKPNTTTKKPNTTAKPTTRKPNTTAKKTNTPRPTPGCFVKGTKVMTVLGYVDIENIHVGDSVLTYNEKKHRNEYKKVVRVFIHENYLNDMYTIKVGGESIKVTGVHKFYIKNDDGYEWVAAAKLKVGDYVKYSNHNYQIINEIDYEQVVETVYNIEVDGNHNYYVGTNQVLVHNKAF